LLFTFVSHIYKVVTATNAFIAYSCHCCSLCETLPSFQQSIPHSWFIAILAANTCIHKIIITMFFIQISLSFLCYIIQKSFGTLPTFLLSCFLFLLSINLIISNGYVKKKIDDIFVYLVSGLVLRWQNLILIIGELNIKWQNYGDIIILWKFLSKP
jgi:hypothetical protein